ncbi:spore coat protein YsxE [Alkalihalobacillus sp. AL-G]|uniref:spore coat protein YsxE n=1 Tax=Alkalihalobacillus sp. AL-G TaxID=2926399 RepID=UPI0027297D80|nr:spore coat protein YsxE [Alkalihalobacillus sp. AL-G]WLD92259.1 spore coat protein YsxE [Alkalihalobacillus sp. AL-G]
MNAASVDGVILYYYDLYPERIESYGQVQKITTSRGTYALKKTNMNKEQLDWFLHCMNRLNEIGYHHVVPIVPTKYGDSNVTNGYHSFYLTRWCDHEARSGFQYEDFIIDELGKLHSHTVKAQSFSDEVVKDSYNALIQRFEQRQLEMERFTELSERQTYISPFELRYLSQFHRLMRMAEDAKQHVISWYQSCEEQKRYRSVMCHGRPFRGHIVVDQLGEGNFINFERAILDTPVRDLAYFFRTAAHYPEWEEQVALEWLGQYERHLPLLPEEKLLLASYLKFPEPVFSTIQTYQGTHDLSQLELVRKLDRKLNVMRSLDRFANQILQPITEMG